MTPKFKAFKGMFFDRAKVINAVDQATRKVLSKFGAFVRTAAKSSIRTRKKAVSAPGQPPFSKTGLLKKFLFFGFDPSTRSVVIGPAKLNSGTNAPEVLEYGGTTTITDRVKGKKIQRRVRIEARPYMGPAYVKEKPKLSPLWANSVKKAA